MSSRSAFVSLPVFERWLVGRQPATVIILDSLLAFLNSYVKDGLEGKTKEYVRELIRKVMWQQLIPGFRSTVKTKKVHLVERRGVKYRSSLEKGVPVAAAQNSVAKYCTSAGILLFAETLRTFEAERAAAASGKASATASTTTTATTNLSASVPFQTPALPPGGSKRNRQERSPVAPSTFDATAAFGTAILSPGGKHLSRSHVRMMQQLRSSEKKKKKKPKPSSAADTSSAMSDRLATGIVGRGWPTPKPTTGAVDTADRSTTRPQPSVTWASTALTPHPARRPESMDTGQIDPSLDDPGMSMPSFIMEPTTADIRGGMRQLAAERRAVVLQTLFTIEVADASKQSKGLDPSTRERNIRAAVKTAHENATPGHTDAVPLLEGSAEERKAQQRALGDLDDLDDLRSILDKLAVLDEIMFQREMAALGQQGQMTLQNVRRLVAKFSGMELARSNRDVHYQLRKKSSTYTSKVELDRLQLFASGTAEFLSVATTTDHTAVYGGESGKKVAARLFGLVHLRATYDLHARSVIRDELTLTAAYSSQSRRMKMLNLANYTGSLSNLQCGAQQAAQKHPEETKRTLATAARGGAFFVTSNDNLEWKVNYGDVNTRGNTERKIKGMLYISTTQTHINLLETLTRRGLTDRLLRERAIMTAALQKKVAVREDFTLEVSGSDMAKLWAYTDQRLVLGEMRVHDGGVSAPLGPVAAGPIDEACFPRQGDTDVEVAVPADLGLEVSTSGGFENGGPTQPRHHQRRHVGDPVREQQLVTAGKAQRGKYAPVPPWPQQSCETVLATGDPVLRNHRDPPRPKEEAPVSLRGVVPVIHPPSHRDNKSANTKAMVRLQIAEIKERFNIEVRSGKPNARVMVCGDDTIYLFLLEQVMADRKLPFRQRKLTWLVPMPGEWHVSKNHLMATIEIYEDVLLVPFARHFGLTDKDWDKVRSVVDYQLSAKFVEYTYDVLLDGIMLQFNKDLATDTTLTLPGWLDERQGNDTLMVVRNFLFRDALAFLSHRHAIETYDDGLLTAAHKLMLANFQMVGKRNYVKQVYSSLLERRGLNEFEQEALRLGFGSQTTKSGKGTFVDAEHERIVNRLTKIFLQRPTVNSVRRVMAMLERIMQAEHGTKQILSQLVAERGAPRRREYHIQQRRGHAVRNRGTVVPRPGARVRVADHARGAQGVIHSCRAKQGTVLALLRNGQSARVLLDADNGAAPIEISTALGNLEVVHGPAASGDQVLSASYPTATQQAMVRHQQMLQNLLADINFVAKQNRTAQALTLLVAKPFDAEPFFSAHSQSWVTVDIAVRGTYGPERRKRKPARTGRKAGYMINPEDRARYNPVEAKTKRRQQQLRGLQQQRAGTRLIESILVPYDYSRSMFKSETEPVSVKKSDMPRSIATRLKETYDNAPVALKTKELQGGAGAQQVPVGDVIIDIASATVADPVNSGQHAETTPALWLAHRYDKHIRRHVQNYPEANVLTLCDDYNHTPFAKKFEQARRAAAVNGRDGGGAAGSDAVPVGFDPGQRTMPTKREWKNIVRANKALQQLWNSALLEKAESMNENRLAVKRLRHGEAETAAAYETRRLLIEAGQTGIAATVGGAHAARQGRRQTRRGAAAGTGKGPIVVCAAGGDADMIPLLLLVLEDDEVRKGLDHREVYADLSGGRETSDPDRLYNVALMSRQLRNLLTKLEVAHRVPSVVKLALLCGCSDYTGGIVKMKFAAAFKLWEQVMAKDDVNAWTFHGQAGRHNMDLFMRAFFMKEAKAAIAMEGQTSFIPAKSDEALNPENMSHKELWRHTATAFPVNADKPDGDKRWFPSTSEVGGHLDRVEAAFEYAWCGGRQLDMRAWANSDKWPGHDATTGAMVRGEGWRAGQAAAADGAAAVGEGGEVVAGAGAAEEAAGAAEEPDDEPSSSSDGEEDENVEAGLELGAVSDVDEDEDEDEV